VLYLLRPPQTAMPFERPLGYTYMHNPALAPTPPPSAPPSVPSMADELEKLAALHDSGHLTDDEFADAKAKLLNRG
jgi:hypothetical protein